MIRLILLALLALVMFLPAVQAEEQYECTVCGSGTFTAFHDSEDLRLVMSWQINVIGISHSENKFLDNATFHCEGVQRGMGENRQGVGYCRTIDPDGDILIIELSARRTVVSGNFLEGTGKYKGIKGGFKAEPLARGKPAMPGTFQFCNKHKGTYELAR